MLDQDQDYLTASSEIILILITKNLIYTNLESIFFFYLEKQSKDVTHEDQFTRHKKYYLAC